MRSARPFVRALPVAMLLIAGAGENANAQATVRNDANAARALAAFAPPLGLAPTYRVALASRWNRPAVFAACPIEGGETVEGTLTWTGTRYEGMLRRASRWKECGAHGRACAIAVEGGAEVQGSGELLREDGRWLLSLRWTPARDVHVEVGGDCPPAYQDAVARMYRVASQRVAFELPPANGFVAEELDPYPWAVRVE
jgi:hypothetical protein